MISINAIIVFFSVIFILCIIVIANIKSKKLFDFNERINKVQNIFTYISLIIAALAILITGLINIISDKRTTLEIITKDGHGYDWYETHNTEMLLYTIDTQEHLSYNRCVPDEWFISIKNSGNIVAENVTIEISFDDVQFYGIPDDYDLKEHLNGLGGYKYITHSYKSIQPNEEINLPFIPFENTDIIDIGGIESSEIQNRMRNEINMYVSIYENSNLRQNLIFPCKYYCEEDTQTCIQEVIEEYGKNGPNTSMLKLKKLNLIGNDYVDCKNIIKNHPELSVEDLKYTYHYYLGKLNVYNPEARLDAKSNSIFYGRLYYISIKENDIDSKINNDINAHTSQPDK